MTPTKKRAPARRIKPTPPAPLSEEERQMWAALPDVLTIAQVAGIDGFSKVAVAAWCTTGVLPATKIGSHWRIRKIDYRNFRKSNQP